jgi:hypothetical protein
MTPDELKAAAVRYAREAFATWMNSPTFCASPDVWANDFERHVTERMSQLAQAAAPSLEVAARVERWADYERPDDAVDLRTVAARGFLRGEEPPR